MSEKTATLSVLWHLLPAKLVLSINKYPSKDPTCSVYFFCPFQWWTWSEATQGGPYCLDIVGIETARYFAWLRVSDEEFLRWRRGRIDVQGRFWLITFCLDHNSAFPARAKNKNWEISSNNVFTSRAATKDYSHFGWILHLFLN